MSAAGNSQSHWVCALSPSAKFESSADINSLKKAWHLRMIKHLIILSTDQLVTDVKRLYRSLNPGLCTMTVSTMKELYAIPRDVLDQSRLISFLSAVIVPSETLGTSNISFTAIGSSIVFPLSADYTAGP